MAEEKLKQNEEEELLTALENITVSSLGLVATGAVGETFFLLKADGSEGAMDELEILEQEGTEANSRTLLEKIGINRLLQLIKRGQVAEAEEVKKQTKIGTFLRQQREKKEMTIAEVAERMPITAGTIASIESGEIETPSEPVLSAFARVYDVPVSRLEGLLPTGAMPGEEGNSKKVETEKVKKLSARDLIELYGDELSKGVAEALQTLSTAASSDDSKKVAKKEDEVKTMADEKGKKVVDTESKDKVEKAEAPAAPAVDLSVELQKRDQQIAELIERVEKSEQAALQAQQVAEMEREARERLGYLEKAAQYQAVTEDVTKLGELLHWLAKEDENANIEKAADAEDRVNRYGYLTELLKTVSEQVEQAGLFKEAGTARTPDPATLTIDQIAKAKVEDGTYSDYKEALMNISAEDYAAYQAQFRN
jgi:transcriptional regulator with XRE-family HTH domain